MTELPTTFGKYFLTEKLATGGMAEIYLAKLVGPGGFEKQLVIKQIHPKLSGQRHFVDLFVNEAKTLVGLTHGNIVPVYELGVVGDIYFIAMEYIDGPTLYRLTEVLSRRDAQMEPNVAAWITARILEGLEYAHRKGEGVIHRDLSPRNVMMSRDGDVKLVDFGIAVTLGEGDVESAQSAPTGSFPYMSPEQVRREPLTGQSDLFSAGVLMWEMLVGHRLFARPSPDATLAAVTGGDIPNPSSQRAEVPARLDEIAMRALERDTEKRWQSAADMLGALQKYLYALEETPGPRDVAALVAKFCPPETRRLPTHAEAAGRHDTASDADEPGRARSPTGAGSPPRSDHPLAGAGSPPRSDHPLARAGSPPGSDHPLAGAPVGPRTAVIPRDGSQPRGKPPRQQSFATHVELKDIFERATPLFPLTAIDDSANPPPTTTEAAPAASASTSRSDEPAGFQIPGRVAPSRGALIVTGLGGVGLAIGAVYVFFRGRAAVERPDAPPRADASMLASGPDAAIAEPPDAIVATGADAVEATDAAPPIDAPTRGDARAPIDAAPALDARPAGNATLKIGADPWGEIYIDGAKRGRTPIDDITVSAGHHVVEIVFSGVDPPLRKRFDIDVTAGETKPLQAEFPH